MENYMKLEIPAISSNEAFARNAVAAFILPLSPTVEQLNDVKTAVSEAVTNSVVHAYKDGGTIYVEAKIEGKQLTVKIIDYGVGIDDIERARQPLYTTRADDERSGLGFTIMETFMDTLEVTSNCGEGTVVTMRKSFA